MRVEIHVARWPPRRPLAEIDERRLAIGHADQHVAAAADVAGKRVRHRQGKTDGDRGIDGIAALCRSTLTPTSAAIDSIATTMPLRARTGCRVAPVGYTSVRAINSGSSLRMRAILAVLGMSGRYRGFRRCLDLVQYWRALLEERVHMPQPSLRERFPHSALAVRPERALVSATERRWMKRSAIAFLLWGAPVLAFAQAPSAEQRVQNILTLPGFRAATTALEADHERFVKELVTLTEIPAPPFKEQKRGAAYLEMLRAARLTDLETDAEGNVMGVRKGRNSGGPMLAVLAHLDTVFPVGTNVATKREGNRLQAPGVGDDTAALRHDGGCRARDGRRQDPDHLRHPVCRQRR